MEGMRELAAVFCAACVLTAGIGILSGEVLKKSVGYILSLILLVSLVGAILWGDYKFEITREAAKEISADNEESISEYQAEYICRQILSEKDISFEKIEATATKTKDGSIIISEITIKGSDRGEEAAQMVIESGLTETVKLE